MVSRRMGVFLSFLVAWTVAAGGCAVNRPDWNVARQAFAAGDFVVARDHLTRLSTSSRRASAPARLDLAMVDLASGNPAAAEATLRELRDELDARPDRDVIGTAASMVTDENAIAYDPPPFEHVMVRTMLAVCSLAKDEADADSYLIQAVKKQSELDERPVSPAAGEPSATSEVPGASELPTQSVALAPYLRGVLREATHHDYDDAQRHYKLVSALRPSFLPAFDDQERVTTASHSQPGHGVLYVVAFVGEGPRLEPIDAPVTAAALAVASALLVREGGEDDDVIPLPSIKTVRVPEVVVPASPIAAVGVTHDGFIGATQSLTNVAELMDEHIRRERPMMIARSIARRATKEFAVHSARQQLGLRGPSGSIFQWAASSAWVATEKADTRCWGLLPRDIQVLRTELPAGERIVHFAPLGLDGRSVGPTHSRRVRIENGRNTYLTAIVPTTDIHLIGRGF